MDVYEIVDKRTNENLVGYHDGGGIYEFDKASKPEQIYTTTNDILRILDRIARFTGRQLTTKTVDYKF
jgi:hypothetical protein